VSSNTIFFGGLKGTPYALVGLVLLLTSGDVRAKISFVGLNVQAVRAP